MTSEPELGEDFCVVVSVRHPEKGLIRRMYMIGLDHCPCIQCILISAITRKRVYQYADTIGSCRYILNMSERDAPNELVISDDNVDLSGNAFDVGDAETERFFQTFKFPNQPKKI